MQRPSARGRDKDMRHGDPYFDWLCMLVNEGTHRGYMELLSELHEFIFVPKMEMDANRGVDGLQLRVDFQKEHGPWGSSTNRGPCTFLEFLVGLCKRMSFLMNGEGTSYIEHYFWRIIANLGLDRCNDVRWHIANGKFFVEDAVYRINERLYSADGNGGLFPLTNPNCDQTKVEIWYQMQDWMMENSNVGDL